MRITNVWRTPGRKWRTPGRYFVSEPSTPCIIAIYYFVGETQPRTVRQCTVFHWGGEDSGTQVEDSGILVEDSGTQVEDSGTLVEDSGTQVSGGYPSSTTEVPRNSK